MNRSRYCPKKTFPSKYLREHGFNAPRAKGYTCYEDALADIDGFRLPVMVKPVDSSGSKGINKLTDKSRLKEFVEDALKYSRDKRFLIEEFIVKKDTRYRAMRSVSMVNWYSIVSGMSITVRR